jgi:hypothetical protein
VPGPVGPEGWYQDPYGRHQKRWFSSGQPTPLVKDGDAEGHDEVSGPLPGPLVPIEEQVWDHGQDLARADEVEAKSVSAPDLVRAGQEGPKADVEAQLDIAAQESRAVD